MAVRLAEPINFSLIIPFVYQASSSSLSMSYTIAYMVEGFGVAKSPKDLAMYTGILNSSYSGQLSDRIGRRPVLLMGLIDNVITFLMFGFAHNYTWALAAPWLSGLGFDSRRIRILLAHSGAVMVYLQLVTYPRLERKHGNLYCYQLGQSVLVPMCFSLLFLSLLAARSNEIVNHTVGAEQSKAFTLAYILLWVFFLENQFMRNIDNVVVYTGANLGLMNGTQQLAMSITCVIGPTFAELVWSWSTKHDLPYPLNAHLVWAVCSLLTVTSLHLSFSIPESVNKCAAIEVDEYSRPLGEQEHIG
ncbi:hypothetical protein DL89DRAFT_256817 [Linderina pennispora]|uniref:MFS general substrate transporter n=1 Tax=Linderina pennispora TaxID=61395 RepID=A0A1Y1WAP5_9FUNG|nr:uncharacterized protein DL89DRAFT_256817 [Linderina pennispora]ORX70617.1 hypothetical protein DL89DRAFT_256817 [Linderina pennispora]